MATVPFTIDPMFGREALAVVTIRPWSVFADVSPAYGTRLSFTRQKGHAAADYLRVNITMEGIRFRCGFECRLAGSRTYGLLCAGVSLAEALKVANERFDAFQQPKPRLEIVR